MRNARNKCLVVLVAAALMLAGCGGGGSGGSGGGGTPTGSTDTPGGTLDSGVSLTAVNDAVLFALPAAINDNNLIIGSAETAAGGILQPVKWRINPDGSVATAAEALQPLVAGGFAAAMDVNDTDVIVGIAANAAGASRAVVWSPGVAVPSSLPLLIPGGFTAAYAINNGGRIVGEAETADGDIVAVRWDRNPTTGALTGPLALPGGGEGAAYAINANGDIAGEHIATTGESGAVVWRLENDAYVRTDLASLAGFPQATALGISNAAAGPIVVGMVAGAGADGAFQAVQWDLAAGTTPTQLGSADSSAEAVNDAGIAVGDQNDRAYQWSPSGQALFTASSAAYDINNNDLIVGRSGSQGFVKLVE